MFIIDSVYIYKILLNNNDCFKYNIIMLFDI